MSNQIQLTQKDAALYQQLIGIVTEMSPELQNTIMELAKQNLMQRGDVNMNNQQQVQSEMVTISKETYEQLIRTVAQAETTPQQPVAPTQPQVDPMQIAQLEDEIIKMQNIINANVNAGLQIPQITMMKYDALLAQYKQLTGMDLTGKVSSILGNVTNRAMDMADKVGNYAQTKIGEQFIPGTINNATGFLADLISLGGELIQGVGTVLSGTIDGVATIAKSATTVTTTTANGLLNTTAKTVSKVGQATSVAAQNTVQTTFNLIRK